MMSLRQLEVFNAIMRTGSITGAAEMLNVTQPAVSATLKHCEAQLKTQLFARLGGRLRPTPEAEVLFREVADIFSRIDAVGHLTRDLVAGRLGSLSIAGAIPITNTFLAEAVATFIKDRPSVRVSLQALPSQQVGDAILRQDVELGVAYEPMASGGLKTELLMRVKPACVFPKDHPLAAKKEVGLVDLQPYPVITYLPQAMLRTHLDRTLRSVETPLNIVAQVGSSITAVMLARYGAGVALVDPFLVDALATPYLASRPLIGAAPIDVLLVRNRATELSSLALQFIEHLRGRLPADLAI